MVLVLLTNPNATVREIVVGRPAYPVLLVAATGALAFRRRLTSAIDRRFFREAYDRERLLQTILDDIDTLGTTKEGIAQIVARLDAALHPKSIRTWFATEDRAQLSLLHSQGEPAPHSSGRFELPPPLLHQLEYDGVALAVSGLPAQGLTQSALRWLHERRGLSDTHDRP